MGSLNLSNVPPDVRALAEESAKRAGLSVGAWLSRTIHRRMTSEAAEGAATPALEDAATMPGAARFHRFLPSPLPAPRDIPVADLRLSRLHVETGLAEGLAKPAARDTPAGGAAPPVVARPAPEGGGFEIVTGLIGWRTAQAAGRDSLPVLVLDLSDHEMIRLILLEILTMADIPPLAEAEAFRWLLHGGEVGEDGLMEISGLARGEIRDRIELLSLPLPVLTRIDDGRFDIELAPALADAAWGDAVSRIAIDHELTIERMRAVVATTNSLGDDISPDLAAAAARELGALLGAEVVIAPDPDGVWSLRITAPGGNAASVYRLRAEETDAE